MAAHLSSILLTAGLGMLVVQAAAAQSVPTSMVAVIEVQPHDGGLDIAARASAITPGNVMAELSVERHGMAGNISTRQSRQLDLDTGESGDIARTSISFTPGDALDVKVTLRQEGQIVGGASLSIERAEH